MCDCPDEKRLREALERANDLIRTIDGHIIDAEVVANWDRPAIEATFRRVRGYVTALQQQAPHKDSCEATITGDSDECDCREQTPADLPCPKCLANVTVFRAGHPGPHTFWPTDEQAKAVACNCDDSMCPVHGGEQAKAGGTGGTGAGAPRPPAGPPPDPPPA